MLQTERQGVFAERLARGRAHPPHVDPAAIVSHNVTSGMCACIFVAFDRLAGFPAGLTGHPYYFHAAGLHQEEQ